MSKVLTDNEREIYLELISLREENESLRSTIAADHFSFGQATHEFEQDYGILLREKELLENELMELKASLE